MYGAVRTRTGTSPNEFTFTGEQVDATGLQYVRARYYDAATGRFASRDPLPLAQRYAYVGGNPANLTDPYGLYPGERYAKAKRAVKKTVEDTACRGTFGLTVQMACEEVRHFDAMRTAVQLADLVPWTAVPFLGLPLFVPSTIIDASAAGFAEVDILRSGCSAKRKFGLTLVNAADLGVGLGGGAVSGIASETAVVQIPIAIETSSVETALYASTTMAINKCDRYEG